MSDNPTGTQTQEMSVPELGALVRSVVKEEMEPLTKRTGGIEEQLRAASEREDLAQVKNIDKELGKYPIGRKIRALAMASIAGRKDDIDCAIFEVKKHWPATSAEPTLKWLAHVKTSLLAGNAAAAGDMIMPQYDPEWIDLLRPMTVVRRIARTIPMPRGASSRRKQTGAATAYYQGETDTMTASNLTVGRVNLSYKKLTAESVISNDLIRFSSQEADQKVQEDILQVVALREDRAFLVGDPPVDAGSPQGIWKQTNNTNIFATTGTTLATYQADLTKAVRLVEESDVPISNCYWLMSPAKYWAIYALATTAGDWMFAGQLNANTLLGFPIIRSTQLKASRLSTWTSVAPATAGMMFFVNASTLEIHDSLQRTVSVWPGGAYYDAASAVVKSGISQDETVVTCISEHDFLMTYDTAAAVITGSAT
jgi:HK97 family phage major capsid protein